MRITGLTWVLCVALVTACADDSRSPTVRLEVSEGSRLAFDVSPDGRTLVFDLLGQLWTVPTEGGRAVPITDAVRDTSEDLDPAISPDGRAVIFASDRPQGVGLFLMEFGEATPRRLSTSEPYTPHTRPSWSPDGDRVAFVSGGGIHVIELPDGEPRLLEIDGLSNRSVTDPTWSPDGTRIVFVNSGRSGGRLWSVPVEGGTAQSVTDVVASARAPEYSPSGDHLAFFNVDSAGSSQLWVLSSGGEPNQLTEHADVTPLRARWLPDGSGLMYHADGRLWTVPASGGTPTELSFTANVSFERERVPLPPVRFAAPSDIVQAKGFAGLELSPGADKVVMIALGQLWIIEPGGARRAVTPLPPTASDASWAPDETEVVWSAGPLGAEDLYATEVATGQTRRLTALPGGERRPSWSTDGGYVAFNHEAEGERRVRSVPAHGPLVETTSATIEVGPGMLMEGLSMCPSNPIMWAPDGTHRLLYTTCNGLVLATLTGDLLELPYPESERPNFMSWSGMQEVIYVTENRLWRAAFDPDSGGIVGGAAVSNDPALYATVARDGSILYVSGDGLRIRLPEGEVVPIGWPLAFEPPTPEPLLIRNAHVIGRTDEVLDVLIEGGRIAAVAPAGELAPSVGVRDVDVDGRFVIPGLIDLHQHTMSDARLAEALYRGVTTVRDAGSRLGVAWLAGWRDAVTAGRWQGPRIVLGGIQHQGLGAYSGFGLQRVTGAATRARSVALQRTFGSEYLKMRIFYDWSGTADLVWQAHRAGMRTSGHFASPLPLVAAGVDGREHLGSSGGDRLDGIPYDDVIQLYRAADMWVVTSLAYYWNPPELDQTETRWDPEVMAFQVPPGQEPSLPSPGRRASNEYFARLARAAALKLQDGGVTIATGTDAAPWTMHFELEQLVEAGLTPLEAIAAATENAALVIGASNEIGRVEEGMWADLVILNANPLDDIRNTREIWMVVKGGFEVDREALLGWVEGSGSVPSEVSLRPN